MKFYFLLSVFILGTTFLRAQNFSNIALSNGFQDGNSSGKVDEPKFSPSKLVFQQYLVGGIISIGAGIAGAYIGYQSVSKEDKGNNVPELGSAALGSFIGFHVTRAFFINYFGTPDGYEGNYFMMLISYTLTTQTLYTFVELPLEYKFFVVDAIGVGLSSWLHFSMLTPKKKDAPTVSISPTILQSGYTTYNAGIQLKLNF